MGRKRNRFGTALSVFWGMVTTAASNGPGKIVTQTQILKELWGPNQMAESGYLRVYVNQIRKKIERDPSNPEILITEPGVGYFLKTNG